MNFRSFVLTATFFACFFTNSVRSALSQVAANATRPSAADNGYLTARNYLEIETGLAADDNNWSLPTLLKFAVLEKVELGFSMQGILSHSGGDTETGDPGAQIKVQIAKREWGAAALVGRTDWPEGLDPKYSAYGVVSYQMQPAQADVTAGVSFFDRGSGDYEQSVFYAVALSPKTNGRLGGYLELFGENSSVSDALSLDAGLSFAQSPRTVADISLAVGLSNDAPDWLFQIGFTRTLFAVR